MLGIVEVVRLDFSSLPFHIRCPHPIPFIRSEHLLLTDALLELEENRLIGLTVAWPGQFISTVFLRYQTVGKVRMILNLSDLNTFLRYEKFKMDSIYTITQIVKRDCYMDSVDLSDTYFSVNIREADRKFLWFVLYDQLFAFCVLPQGLASAPRLFTKLLKPVFVHLRFQGFESCLILMTPISSHSLMNIVL